MFFTLLFGMIMTHPGSYQTIITIDSFHSHTKRPPIRRLIMTYNAWTPASLLYYSMEVLGSYNYLI